MDKQAKAPVFLGQNPWTRNLAQCNEGTLLGSFPAEVHPLIYHYWLALKLKDKPDIGSSILSTKYSPHPFGSHGSGPGQFIHPGGVAVDVFGNIYVTEPENNRIQAFNKDGVYLREWGTLGDGDGQLFFPIAITVDHYDDLVVVDRGNNRCQVFEPSGKFKLKFGSFGFGEEDLWDHSAVCMDNNGNIAVAVEGHHRISLFSSSGVWLRNFGYKTAAFVGLYQPVALAIDHEGNYIVGDRGNKIQTFDSAGNPIRLIGTSALTMGGLGVDGAGNIIIADHSLWNHRLVVVSKDGQLLSYVGMGCLDFPKSPVVDRRGNIIVTDAGQNRIQVLMPGPFETFDSRGLMTGSW